MGQGGQQPVGLRESRYGHRLDDLIRPLQQRLRDRQAERLGGLEVDDQFELRGLLDGEVGGLGASQYLIDIGGGTPVFVGEDVCKGNESTGLGEFPVLGKDG